MLAIASAVYSFLTAPPPYVDIQLPLSFVPPKLPLTWAAIIVLVGIIFIVFEGGYRLRKAEQAQERQDKKATEEAYETLQHRLQNLSVELVSAEAVEAFSQKDTFVGQPYHRVSIDLTLKVGNGDGQNTSTIEPVTCESNLRSDGKCDRMGFNDGVYGNVVERDFLFRTIPPGTIRLVTLRVVYDLPMSDPLPVTKLKGNLTLKDNRGTLLPSVSFSTDLRKVLGIQK
jgi:hypothetical protein